MTRPFEIWDPSLPPKLGDVIAIDTETELITSKAVAPDLVIMQVYDGEGPVHIVFREHVQAYLQKLLDYRIEADYVMHNASFDCAVLARMCPEGHMFKALAGYDKLHDTMLRYALWSLRKTGQLDSVSLKSAAHKVLDVTLSKDEDIRLAFKTEVRPSHEQLEYASSDVVVTWDLHRAMLARDTITEATQVRAALALDAMSRLGFRVDPERQERLKTNFQQRIEDTLQILYDNGYTPKMSGNKAAMQRILSILEKQYGITFQRTEKTGELSIAKGAFSSSSCQVPFLTALKDYDHCNKMISAYLSDSAIGEDGRAHARVRVIMKTGRTSLSEPPLQQLPRKEGLRGIYVPTEGYALCATDYNQLELCTLAQTCLKRYGASVLADTINSGVDVHKFLASKIYRCDLASVTKDMRQLSKAASFGLPGGLSPKTFVTYAQGYGVNIDVSQATDVKRIWLDTFPEMKKHLQPNQVALDMDDGVWYTASSLTGLVRNKCTYTEAANFPFQSLAGDGAKRALWRMNMEQFRIVNFIHDEIITEIPLGTLDEMAASVSKQEELMVDAMREVCPDVRIACGSSLMDRWLKTDGKQDEHGRWLIVTESESN
jgi:DNA polymerase I-like protein with 3'-5' exonuclease and polymerase domains